MAKDLTDAQWALLEPLLPPPPQRSGRPRYRSRRELINGIRWRFRESSRWDRIPLRYGPHQTAYALFYAWRKDGTWERLAAVLDTALDTASEGGAIIPWAKVNQTVDA